MKSPTMKAGGADSTSAPVVLFRLRRAFVDPSTRGFRFFLFISSRRASSICFLIRGPDGGKKWAPANISVPNPTDWNNVQVSQPEPDGRRYYYAVGVRSGNYYAPRRARDDWQCGSLELWRSPDRGLNWKKLAGPRLAQHRMDGPGNCVENIDIAPSATSPRKVYLLTANYSKRREAQAGEVWVSNDEGDTWDAVKGTDFPHYYDQQQKHADNWSQSGYNFYIKSAKNPRTGRDIIYVGLIDLVALPEEGRRWQTVGDVYSAKAKTHADQHALVFNPRNPNDFLIGNDGGVYRVTYDSGKNTWTFKHNLNAGLGMTMFYRIAAHPTNLNWVMGGAQDNATPVSMGDLSAWSNKGVDDGGFCAIHPVTPKVQYATSQYLEIYRTEDEWKSQPEHITKNAPWGDEPMAFIAPIAPDPLDANKLYAATNRLWLWEKGKGWTLRSDGRQLAVPGEWVSYIAVAADGRHIYTGSSAGDLMMTDDGGTTWRRLDNDGLPTALPALPINSIAIHPTKPYMVLVAFGSVGQESHLWRSDDTRLRYPVWRRVGRGEKMLESVPLNDVIFHPLRPDTTFYVATDLGVFQTNNGGGTWASLGAPLGLPQVRVTDLEMLPTGSHLIAATYGRGAWRLQLPEDTDILYFKPAEKIHWKFDRTRQVRSRRR